MARATIEATENRDKVSFIMPAKEVGSQTAFRVTRMQPSTCSKGLEEGLTCIPVRGVSPRGLWCGPTHTALPTTGHTGPGLPPRQAEGRWVVQAESLPEDKFSF